MNQKKVLTLVVAEPWFSMIVSGKKTEEYREIKPYWVGKLVNQDADCGFVGQDPDGSQVIYGQLEFLPYTHVLFVNGYGKTRPRIEKEIKGITVGKPQKGLCPANFFEQGLFHNQFLKK